MSFIYTTLFLILSICIATSLGHSSFTKKDPLRKQYIQDELGNSRGYSQAVVVDHLQSGVRHVYLAGMASDKDADLANATLAVWDSMERVLAAAGGKLSDLVTMTSAIPNLTEAKKDIFNGIRVQVLNAASPGHGLKPYPGSMLLGATLARPALLVEMQAQAMFATPKDWKIKPVKKSDETPIACNAT